MVADARCIFGDMKHQKPESANLAERNADVLGLVEPKKVQINVKIVSVSLLNSQIE
ncbi:hypothetical protein AVEN_191715-1, partial [Araneus ventricosus]